ncbi:Putative cytoplasmic protein [methanotrophic endosymbiont of Bathymodiolus azoricus (Menez Gwen)]|nr:Putative cytoplasmic protein [methanotrophic endosymbiont of Bathymodiolus azoricus (Menez Gwen)]
MNQPLSNTDLFIEVKGLIQSAKQQAAVAVNAELTLLYWQVGKRIADEVLKGERAEYGQPVIKTLAKQLTESDW